MDSAPGGEMTSKLSTDEMLILQLIIQSPRLHDILKNNDQLKGIRGLNKILPDFALLTSSRCASPVELKLRRNSALRSVRESSLELEVSVLVYTFALVARGHELERV